MKKYIPSMYKKSIFDINYDKLKNIGIKCLIFDLDNTIALIDTKLIPEEVKTLFIKLKKDFNIVIISRTTCIPARYIPVKIMISSIYNFTR